MKSKVTGLAYMAALCSYMKKENDDDDDKDDTEDDKVLTGLAYMLCG